MSFAAVLPWIVFGLCKSALGAPGPGDPAKPVITPPPKFPLKREQYSSLSTLCAYVDGDPKKPIVAPKGSACNYSSDYWGLCATSALDKCTIYATCIDSYTCSNACPATTKSKDYTAVTCPTGQWCVTALVTYNVQQTSLMRSFTSIGCGTGSATTHWLMTPTIATTESSPTDTPTPLFQTPSSSGTSTAAEGVAPGSPTTASASPSTAPSGGQQPSSAGAIAGGVVGGLAVLCGSAVAIIFLLKKSRKAKSEPSAVTLEEEPDDQLDDKSQVLPICYKYQDDSRFTDADTRSELPGDLMGHDSPAPSDFRSTCFSPAPSSSRDTVTMPPWAASELPVQYSRMSHRAEMPG
ncbi:hypothetical protein O9K51_03681 [Purpureocillium lavendulum]|uniref:Uncharacterized protein n=1 Tax=Purpureocillium lavendulum TaxID=1247861 RepID=A0AB34FV28_9HYPO|nr:hypothetical protein O9K51_03681 [Purpureocillium lavendulum]